MVFRLPLYLAIIDGGIWDVPFYPAICAEVFEIYRILHRVGGLFVVLRFQILVCRCLGFIVYAEALLICASRLRGVEDCLTEAVGDENNTDPGFDGMIPPVYMAEGSP